MDLSSASFCITEVAKWILENGYSKVALEFADIPSQCVEICKKLEEKIGFVPYILHDPNRACGNCCVDIRTARPRGIQAIVHFGSTCLTHTDSFPVLYVLSSPINFDSDRILKVFLSEDSLARDKKLILFYDILCTPSVGTTYELLQNYFSNLILTIPKTYNDQKLIYSGHGDQDATLRSKFRTSIKQSNLSFNSRYIDISPDENISDYDFLYIGPESPYLVSLQLRFSDKAFYCVDPFSYTLNISDFSKCVLKRSNKIEQIKSAKTIGIINSLPPRHNEIVKRLKRIIKTSGKCCYSFFIGKINEAKLGNIVGVDVFVYVGCPQSSLFDRVENRYLYKNIVTPWEIEVSLNPELSWSLSFELDFQNLLLEEESKKETYPNLVNSKLLSSDRLDEFPSTICLKNPGTVSSIHENAAGEIFTNLSWKGLNPGHESVVPIGTIIQGKKGIAIEYEDEGN